MYWLTVLLVCLPTPSVSGWYAVESFSLVSISLCNACQNCDRNILSQSEMSSMGRQFSQYQLVKRIHASLLTVWVVVQGMICISEPSLLVRANMPSKPLSGGNGPMKSKATESQCLSGMGNGCRGLIVRRHPILTHILNSFDSCSDLHSDALFNTLPYIPLHHRSLWWPSVYSDPTTPWLSPFFHFHYIFILIPCRYISVGTPLSPMILWS